MVGESNKNNKKSGSEQIDLDTAATVIGWYVDWGQRWDDTVIDVHNRECWSWLTSSGHSLSSYTGDSDSAAPTMLSNKTISLSENIWYQQKNILLSSFKEKVLCKLNLLFHLKKGWNYIFCVHQSMETHRRVLCSSSVGNFHSNPRDWDLLCGAAGVDPALRHRVLYPLLMLRWTVQILT